MHGDHGLRLLLLNVTLEVHLIRLRFGALVATEASVVVEALLLDALRAAGPRHASTVVPVARTVIGFVEGLPWWVVLWRRSPWY